MDGVGGAFIIPFLVAALGLVIAVPVLLLIRGALDGSIDGGMAAGCCLAILGLTVLTWKTQGTLWMLLFVVLLLAASGGIPVYLHNAAQKDLRRLDEEDIVKYTAALERDPRNASAHALLAEAYLKTGRANAAVQHLQAAVAIGSAAAGEQHEAFNANPQLEKWRRRLVAAQEQSAREAQERAGSAARI